MNNFRFDPLSFLIGLLTGWGIAFILYRFRRELGRIRDQFTRQAEQARTFATRTADARYQIDLFNYCQQYHIAGGMADLSDILVEPRFVQGIQPYDTTGERKLFDVFHVIPMVHEYPAIYAPYNIRTIGIPDLGAGARHLALLGHQGSGRSTALAAAALWALGQIEFPEPEDVVQAAIDAQEARLDEADQERLRQRREQLKERALAQIKRAQEESQETGEQAATAQEIIDLHNLMPILVHLTDITIDSEAEGALDPAEPLVRAIQGNMRRLTAITVPRYIYNRLNSGQALVLIDGLDDLQPEERARKLAWLRRFMTAYEHCIIIVTGPVSGYHALLQLGMTPIYMRPWTERHAWQLATQWATVWPQAAGTRRQLADPPAEPLVNALAQGTRSLQPLALTLRVLGAYHTGELLPRQYDWYHSFVTRRFQVKGTEEDPLLAQAALDTLALIAAEALRGTLSEARLREIATTALLVEPSPEAIAAAEDKKDGKEEEPETLLDINEFFKAAVRTSGLMVRCSDDQYEFKHPLLGAFTASLASGAADAPYPLLEIADDPHWQPAIQFIAAAAPGDLMNRVVVYRLSQNPDLLFTNLFLLVPWLADAPEDAPWRGEIFKRLAAAMVAPAQFPVLRERALGALIASRDPNVMIIMRQALRSTDLSVRALGCIGIGALGLADGVRDLRPMLEDEALDVQLAAGLALGAIGSEQALDLMQIALARGHETLRQAVAEELAAFPGEGHQLLHQGIESPDMMVRRASIFGLLRIDSPWSAADLYNALLEDDEWYVRSAAEGAFTQRASQRSNAAVPHPPLETLDWLIDWTEEQGPMMPMMPPDDEEEEAEEDGSLTAENALLMMLLMLQSGEEGYRMAAARTLGYLGYFQAINRLYQALSDYEEPIRITAYAALADLQTQIGQPFPGVLQQAS